MPPPTTRAVASPVAALPSRAPSAGLTPDAVARAGTAIARYGVVVVLLAIGLLKFTAAEAEAIRPLIATSPLLSWMYALLSVRGASNAIGVAELAAALGIAARPLSPRAAVAGSAVAVATFLVTLSFLATAPGAWDATLGFPHFGEMGPFLLKDLVLLGASVWSLGEAYAAAARREAMR